MHHCLAQLLGLGPAALALDGEPVGLAVVVDKPRMVDRDVGRPLLEVADRVAAHLHDHADELVSLPDGALRVVDELSLS